LNDGAKKAFKMRRVRRASLRMSLRFLPTSLGGTTGNLLALLWGQFVSPSFPSLLAAKLPELDGGGVFVVRLTLWQFGVTRGHIHDEFGELVEVSGTFAFWHGSSMPWSGGICDPGEKLSHGPPLIT
jgi:hypothetical protein